MWGGGRCAGWGRYVGWGLLSSDVGHCVVWGPLCEVGPLCRMWVTVWEVGYFVARGSLVWGAHPKKRGAFWPGVLASQEKLFAVYPPGITWW